VQPDALSQVVQLEEWHHPDLAGGEKSSEVETSQHLACVLLGGEISRYRTAAPANTGITGRTAARCKTLMLEGTVRRDIAVSSRMPPGLRSIGRTQLRGSTVCPPGRRGIAAGPARVIMKTLAHRSIPREEEEEGGTCGSR
jgi:hypothetical protein